MLFQESFENVEVLRTRAEILEEAEIHLSIEEIRQCDEGAHLRVEVQQQHGSDIRHALNVANVWTEAHVTNTELSAIAGAFNTFGGKGFNHIAEEMGTYVRRILRSGFFKGPSPWKNCSAYFRLLRNNVGNWK